MSTPTVDHAAHIEFHQKAAERASIRADRAFAAFDVEDVTAVETWDCRAETHHEAIVRIQAGEWCGFDECAGVQARPDDDA